MNMFDDLLASSSSSRVSAETLEMLGRKASQLFQQNGVPLNEAVKQVAADMPELGNEHIKRIVEFANTVTFQEQFQSGADKNVHFEVADPGVILRDLKDGGSPAHDGKTLQGGMGDYKTPPSGGMDNGLDNELAGMFNPGQGSDQGLHSNEQMKLASVRTDHSLHTNPIDDVYDTHVRLQAAREKVAEVHERFDFLVKQAKAELYEIVKHEVVDPDGVGLGGVVGAFEKMASVELSMSVLRPLIEKLSEERIMLTDSLEKRAGSILNPAHPLVQTISGLVKAAQEQVIAATALADIDGHLTETGDFLKNAGAITTGVKKAVGNKGPVTGALRQRFPRK